MARMARVVVPGFPHHVTQRGNRRQNTFFRAEDYQTYFDLLVEAKSDAGVEVLAYCFMPNHVHIVLVPECETSLAMFFKEAHRQYTRGINFRHGWRGHLWQERFHSFVMDEDHLLSAVRYTELNPVKARLCKKPTDWYWSSALAHQQGRDNELVTVKPMLDRVGDWVSFLKTEESVLKLDTIRIHSRTGRPAGNSQFIGHLESITHRTLGKKKPGPRISHHTQYPDDKN